MTPFLPFRFRAVAAAFALAAAASAPALFAQGDMESDWMPNTTIFFDELLPAHEAQEEAEVLADLALNNPEAFKAVVEKVKNA